MKIGDRKEAGLARLVMERTDHLLLVGKGALMKGEIVPQGRLPVNVSERFPLGSGLRF